MRGASGVAVLACVAVLLGLGALPADAGNGTSLDAVERQIVAAINEYRSERGRKPVRIDKRLMKVADLHTRWMASEQVFSHGRNWQDRIRRRFDAKRVGEVLGMLTGVARKDEPVGRLMEAWRGSKTHRKQLLTSRFRYVGISRRGAETESGERITLVTVDFGSADGRR